MRRFAVLGGIAAIVLIAGGARPQTPLSQPAESQPPSPQPPPSPPPAFVPTTCDAPSLSWLVGKPRTEIPVPVQPAMRRVYCNTCMVTQDYVPSRTDIVFDAETGLVTAVKCG